MAPDSHAVEVGIDIGSISVNTVVVDAGADGGLAILEDHYDYCRGMPYHVLRARLADIAARWGAGALRRVALTGTGGAMAARLIGGTMVNEIVAQAASVCRLHPEARTIIEMGGEDTKLIFVENGSLSDFVMNSICAAGTGSFLDQQARRLTVSIEGEFGSLALKSTHPPRIAGRCSVFAKSDMIHLQQIATPVEDIIAGLCFAVARNVKSTLARGRELVRPVVFQGGVAANAGMVRAFREVFSLRDGELTIPAHHASMGAIGALLVLRGRAPETEAAFRGLDALDRHLEQGRGEGAHLDPLTPPLSRPTTAALPLEARDDRLPVALGVDVGSLSTNVVLIDRDNRVVARRYLPTAGRPLEAIQRGLREIGAEVDGRVDVRAVGTTGSGRYLTGDFVGADAIRNEITAQTTAALAADPTVDTIFEIGGQDSKFVSIQDGIVVDFEMNKVCAAGTGSFLEEQAEKLGVSIVGEFGSLALCADRPAHLGDRCTVFMETDLNAHQQKGARREDLIAGLAYSIVHNYLQKVVGDKPVGRRIFFQGGVAHNQAVVSAFEKVLGRPVTVPPHFDVTGAIGAAMLARDSLDGGLTRFKGFGVAERTWSTDRFACTHCSNVCEIRKVRVQGEARPLYYGGRCERYEVPERKGKGKGIPDLFAERDRLLQGASAEDSVERDGAAAGSPTIGIPRALAAYHQSFPFWRTFFGELGMRVVLSRPTDQGLVARSQETLTAETCFPVEVVYGHVFDLLERGADWIFLPFVVDAKAEPDNPTSNCNCPWIQSYPFMVRGALRSDADLARLLTPALHFRHSEKLLHGELAAFMEERFGTPAAETVRAARAAQKAQDGFEAALAERGRAVLASLPPGVVPAVMLGRPYNTADPALNLRIVEKLIRLDVLPIPLDFLPLAGERIFGDYPAMYWPNGRKILQAARIVARDPRLQAIYLGNFRCGPDSFISHFVRRELAGKPYLHVEMDEHSADAGLVTRLEAFLESLRSRGDLRSREDQGSRGFQGARGQQGSRGDQARPATKAPRAPARSIRPRRQSRAAPDTSRTIYFPAMCDGAHALAAACRACGVPAEVLPPTDERDLALGRAHTSSRECFPMICTTGSFLRKLLEPGVDPARVSFFMPDHNGPCRFGQYNTLQRGIFDSLGYHDAAIAHPSNADSYAGFPGRRNLLFRFAMWKGVVAVDILRKLVQERRPYEVRPGHSNAAYARHLELVVGCVERGGWGIRRVLRDALDDFAAVPVTAGPRKPVVSVVGEIYMRDNPTCNGFVVDRLEALGAETLMGPVRDWIDYSTLRRARDARRRGERLEILRGRIQGAAQRRIEEDLVRLAEKGGAEMHRDIPVSRMLELCMPYVHRDYDGDPPIALGAATGQAASGIAGVLNILPFTCLPGTILAAVSPKWSADHGGIPWMNVAYDGQDDAGLATRLEAFVYRTREYAARNGLDAPRSW